ncbi:hypothetical protein E3N88_06292 [Mikania micrantha]|uniref:RING-type E3 ubiquitin transferase n=1 Tax=Mikania micrantha TaxID=192012 RepID=A0A5N6PPK3_9ASTR|nr:hypothetical protein E3N88_06292 [Mikania micrantha]
MSSGGNTHWCYQCLQPVRLRGRNPVCPYCSGGFVQELSEVVEPGQQDMGPTHAHGPYDYGFMEPFPVPRNRMMDLFSELIRQRMAGRNPNIDIRRRSGLVPEHGVVPWFIFDGQAPARMSSNDGFEFFFNGAPAGQRRSNHNSCPVCRVELPAHGASSSGGSRGEEDGGGNSRGRRNPLSFLWPF